MKIHIRSKYMKNQEICENFIKFYHNDSWKWGKE